MNRGPRWSGRERPPTLSARLRAALHHPRAALLPLRFLFGVTFLYAGLDKLLDPAFLQVSGRGSIGDQLADYVQISPLGGLISFVAQPYPIAVGIGIALIEIAIGLGAVLGLAFRLAAFGGFVLSVVFFLTASWAVHPYYLGNDVPYAIGWLTLTLAGSGGLFALDDVLARRFERSPGRSAAEAISGDPAPWADPIGTTVARQPGWLDRRAVLRGGILGLMALALGGVSTVAETALGRRTAAVTPPSPGPSPSPAATSTSTPVPSPSSGPSGSPPPTPVPSPTPVPTPPQGTVIAKVADVKTGRPVDFEDPITGDPGVLLLLSDGSFVAYDLICPHAGCTVDYERATGLLVCPCHGATFDPTQHAKAIAGPTFRPLAPFPIQVDPSTGAIVLLGG